MVFWTALLFLVMAHNTPVWAQDDNFSRVDFFQGSLINSGRVIGLGGAFVSVAEGGDGYLSNPASYAHRLPQTRDEWWDWDFAFSFVQFTSESNMDLDRSGIGVNYTDASRLYMGLNFYIKRHGFGLYLLDQDNVFEEAPGAEYLKTQYSQMMYGLGYAYAFLDGDLVLGLNMVQGTAWFQGIDEEGDFHDIKNASISEGTGFHFGALWAPCDDNLRIGATLRTPTTVRRATVGNDEEPPLSEPDLVGVKVPNELHIPWQLVIGASTMMGPRPYNICPTFGVLKNRKRRELDDRRYIIFSGDLVVTGPAPDAIGMRSFLSQSPQSSGQTPSLSVHFGAESEAIQNLLILRVGAYYEPSRFNATSGRLHGTGGLDVRLPVFRDWRLGVSFDWAEDYLNAGLGFGFWH
jgi:hypothetical protein